MNDFITVEQLEIFLKGGYGGDWRYISPIPAEIRRYRQTIAVAYSRPIVCVRLLNFGDCLLARQYIPFSLPSSGFRPGILVAVKDQPRPLYQAVYLNSDTAIRRWYDIGGSVFSRYEGKELPAYEKFFEVLSWDSEIHKDIQIVVEAK